MEHENVKIQIQNYPENETNSSQENTIWLKKRFQLNHLNFQQNKHS
jgi:hypothetical protein